MRLVGEDEASADTHRAPHAPPKKRRTFGRRKTPKAAGNEQSNEVADEGEPVEKIDNDNTEQDLDDDVTCEENGVNGDQETHQDGGANNDGADEDEKDVIVAASFSDTVPELPQNLVEGGQEAGQDKTKWSWVGTKSPLLDAREEAEWILDRLQDRLRTELASVVEGNDA